MDNGHLLRGRFVFLSASFPSERRAPQFFQSASPDEVTQAVVATVRAILSSRGRLVFCGHPTISPLVLMEGEKHLPRESGDRKALKAEGRSLVVVYQSEVFGTVVPGATMKLFQSGLADLMWTKAAAGELPPRGTERVVGEGENSLRTMREVMLRRNRPVAAIFIGGMEGVMEEASLFREVFPNHPMYFIAGPGGAASMAGSDYRLRLVAPSWLKKEDLGSRAYPPLMQRIMLDMASRF